MDQKEYVVLNIRSDLTRKTRDRIKKMCNERNITYGQLLEETFAEEPLA